MGKSLSSGRGGRYTIYYFYRNRVHTIQFPAGNDEDAKDLARLFWDGMLTALQTKFSQKPKFQLFEAPGGRRVNWKP